jgi:ABC-type multidrug transport system fused ATPase/permease subunit
MKKDKGYKKLLSQLITYVKPHKSVFIWSVVFDLLAIGLNMTIPIFSGLAIDALIGVGMVDFASLIRCLLIIGVLTVFSSLFDWWGSHYMNVLTYKTSQSIRKAIYQKPELHSFICSPKIVFDNSQNVFTTSPQYFSNINSQLDLFAESIALNNLTNLGLIEMSFIEYASDMQVYENIINSEKALNLLETYNNLTQTKDAKYEITKKGVVRLTDVGRSFAKICL